MFSNSNSGAGCYVFANRDGLFHTKDSLEKSGWTFRNILVWDKVNMTMGYHWRNQVEYIVYCSKGATKKYVTGLPNIFHEKKPTGLSAKPSKIWETIMERQLKDGEVVCDPFAGSDPLSISLNNNQNLMQKIGSSYSNIFP
jgi:site-specific DNA-methyltransferase (adenine-specific)